MSFVAEHVGEPTANAPPAIDVGSVWVVVPTYNVEPFGIATQMHPGAFAAQYAVARSQLWAHRTSS